MNVTGGGNGPGTTLGDLDLSNSWLAAVDYSCSLRAEREGTANTVPRPRPEPIRTLMDVHAQEHASGPLLVANRAFTAPEFLFGLL